MKSPQGIKDRLDPTLISDAVYPFLEPLILKVYYMGYTDAVDIYQKCIDLKGLREEWGKKND